jgi:hypothetical protein
LNGVRLSRYGFLVGELLSFVLRYERRLEITNFGLALELVRRVQIAAVQSVALYRIEL